MKRVLIDNGSVADILFKGALHRMSLKKVGTSPIRTPLFSFFGERIVTEGKVTLPVIFGVEKRPKATHMVEFLAVEKD